MGKLDDPFVPLADPAVDQLIARAARPDYPLAALAQPAATLARLHGFDVDEQPLVVGLAHRLGEVVPARTTCALQRAQVGLQVVLVFEDGDPLKPIITGVLRPRALAPLDTDTSARGVTVQVDDERHVITAEREIVLRCGDASITLTRAGKVIIKGSYILSRSSGYNKIKGAAIDIN